MTAARRFLPQLAGAIALGFALGASLAWRSSHAVAAVSRAPLGTAGDLAGRPDALVRAVQAARARWEANPTDAAALEALTALHHANGFVAAAHAGWELLRKSRPTDARWSYYLADLARMQANEDALRRGLEETVRLARDYAPAWLELGDLEFKTGHAERAADAYRERLRLVPDDAYASLGLARVALQSGQREEGRRLVDELVRRAPEFSSAQNLQAELLAQAGDKVGAANARWRGTVAGRFRAAPDPWKELLREYCYDVDQLVVWGAIDLQTKTGDRGRHSFERAIEVDPGDPEGYENLGLFFLETEDAARAAAILEKGAALPRASELLFAYLGDAYLRLQQPAEALRAVGRGLAIMPGSARLENLRGLALAAQGRVDEAIAAYEHAIRMAAGLVDPVVNLGLIHLQQGNRPQAIAQLERALVLQPGHPKATTTLAHLKLESGDLAGAAPLVFGYFEQFPGLANARTLLARYYFTRALQAAQANAGTAAEKACRDGLAMVPDSPELNGFLGHVVAQAGRLEEALPYLARSYELQPADPRVALALAEIYVRLHRPADARPVLEATGAEARRRHDAAVEAAVQRLQRQL